MAQSTVEAPPTAPAKPKSKALVLIVVAVVLGAGGSGAAWFFLVHGKKASAAASSESTEKKKTPEYTLHLDSFTVNLADPEEAHFLRVTMELGLESAPKGDPGKEGEGSDFPTAQTRDAILTVLSACKANDLLTTDGKEALKQRLIGALQQKVPQIGARDVYFTEFLVQR